jgi:hypothetical protein
MGLVRDIDSPNNLNSFDWSCAWRVTLPMQKMMAKRAFIVLDVGDLYITRALQKSEFFDSPICNTAVTKGLDLDLETGRLQMQFEARNWMPFLEPYLGVSSPPRKRLA